MLREQKIRSVLYYASVLVFFMSLPYILSYALGFKFNPRTLKFTKTGIIAIETQPAGASVYLNGVLLDKKTPVTVQELLPGKYNVRIELERHYPWSSDTTVEGRRVSRLDKIILFPLRPNAKKLNKEKISSFWVDKERGRIYYVDLRAFSTMSSFTRPLSGWRPRNSSRPSGSRRRMSSSAARAGRSPRCCAGGIAR